MSKSYHSKGHIINNRYKVIDILGEGAMSSVYLVEDLKIKKAEWALKELKLDSILPDDKEGAIALFKREGEILRALHHPGFPNLIDFYSDGNQNNYLVMERISGKTIDEVLGSRIQPLRIEEAVPIALQISHIMEYLHSLTPPIIFRDIKPSNLMLTDSGRVCFIDFGIARYYDKKQEKDTQELGTPGFCAPEQYRGHSTLQSDIYSLGATLFYLLTLKDPQSFNFKFPPISTINSKVPSLLDNILEKCLNIDFKERYSSANELRQALEQTLCTMNDAPNGSTRSLEPALMALSYHYKRVHHLNWKSVWSFWSSWLKYMFSFGKKNLDELKQKVY